MTRPTGSTPTTFAVWMTGCQDGIRDKIISANPHLLIFSSGGGLPDSDNVAGRVRAVAGVKSATPFVLQQALFTTEGGGSHGGLVRGVDLTTPAVLADLKAQVRSGGLEPLLNDQRAVLLGVELARTLGVVVGDALTASSPSRAMTAVGMVPKMRRLIVAGTIEIGMYEYDSSMAYLSLPAA